MHIFEKTSTILKLQAEDTLGRRYLTGLFGLAFLLSGIGTLLYSSAVSTLTCDRFKQPQAKCKLITSSFFIRSVKPLPPGHLKNAVMDTGEEDDEHQILLITNQDRILFPGAYVSGYTQKRITLNSINVFLQNPGRAFFRVQQDDRWFIYSIGGIGTLLGSCFFYFSFASKLQKILVFDKKSDQIYLKKENVLTSEIIKYSLDEMIEAKVFEEFNDGVTIYQTKLRFISDQPLLLEMSGSRAKHYKIAQSINQWRRLGT